MDSPSAPSAYYLDHGAQGMAREAPPEPGPDVAFSPVRSHYNAPVRALPDGPGHLTAYEPRCARTIIVAREVEYAFLWVLALRAFPEAQHIAHERHGRGGALERPFIYLSLKEGLGTSFASLGDMWERAWLERYDAPQGL